MNDQKTWTREEVHRRALLDHPDCQYVVVAEGISDDFEPTWVAKIWRTLDDWERNNPPTHVVEGYLMRAE